ncbi:MAG: hypothetical protein MI864_03425 [Pseudomonadales bacterium]|nr:hypothetical protein [Pseudomonadales bacterium]
MSASQESPVTNESVNYTEELPHIPSTLKVIPLMLRPRFGQSQSSKRDVPNLTLKVHGVKFDSKKMSAYNKVCLFADPQKVSCTYPHIVAFPLHMKMLTHPEFPYPTAGLVHLSNTLTQYRQLEQHEIFDVECQMSTQRESAKGFEFDIVTLYHCGGKLVWEGKSTYLRKAKTSQSSANKAKPKNANLAEGFANHQIITLASNLGRQYAKVSGDINPIHMYDLTAKLFGFKQAIIHGMWSKARSIAALEPYFETENFSVHVDFKLPVLLPATVKLNWNESAEGIDILLTNESSTKPHVSGKVTFLSK